MTTPSSAAQWRSWTASQVRRARFPWRRSPGKSAALIRFTESLTAELMPRSATEAS
jgi:hypothetical protein